MWNYDSKGGDTMWKEDDSRPESISPFHTPKSDEEECLEVEEFDGAQFAPNSPDENMPYYPNNIANDYTAPEELNGHSNDGETIQPTWVLTYGIPFSNVMQTFSEDRVLEMLDLSRQNTVLTCFPSIEEAEVATLRFGVDASDTDFSVLEVFVDEVISILRNDLSVTDLLRSAFNR